MKKTFFHTTTFNNYNDRLADLLTYKNRGDKDEFERLAGYLDRRLANNTELADWLKGYPQYDHRNVKF